MGKLIKDNEVVLFFKKKRELLNRRTFEKKMTSEINKLENLGIEILNIHFTGKSESIYIAYKVNEYNEERLGLKGKIYAGSLALSGHERLYDGNTTTLLYNTATDFTHFFELVTSHIEEVLASKDKVEDNFSIIDKRMFTILQLINYVTQHHKHFEIFNEDIDSSGIIPIMYLTNRGQPIFLVEDEISSDYYRKLREASLFNVLYKRGAGTDRANLNFSSLAIGMFSSYGSYPEPHVISAFEKQKTFGLWRDEEQKAPVEKPITVPDEGELAKLDITEEWFLTFADYLKKAMAIKPTIKERNEWLELIEELAVKWLPEENEMITGYVNPAKDFGKIFISADTGETNAEFVTISLVDKKDLPPFGDSIYHIFIDEWDTDTAIKLLHDLQYAFTNLTEGANIIETIGTTPILASTVRGYFCMKRLQDYKLNFGLDLRGVPIVIYQGKNQELAETLDDSLATYDLTEMVSLFSEIGVISKKAIVFRKSTKYTTNDIADKFISYAQSEMPWVQGELLTGDHPWVPLLVEHTKPLIRFVTIPDLVSL